VRWRCRSTFPPFFRVPRMQPPALPRKTNTLSFSPFPMKLPGSAWIVRRTSFSPPCGIFFPLQPGTGSSCSFCKDFSGAKLAKLFFSLACCGVVFFLGGGDSSFLYLFRMTSRPFKREKVPPLFHARCSPEEGVELYLFSSTISLVHPRKMVAPESACAEDTTGGSFFFETGISDKRFPFFSSNEFRRRTILFFSPLPFQSIEVFWKVLKKMC